jgi:hypothetical protein
MVDNQMIKIGQTRTDMNQTAFTIKAGSKITIGITIGDGVVQNVDAILTTDACVWTCGRADPLNFNIIEVLDKIDHN